MKLSQIKGIETTTYCNRDCVWCVNGILEPRDMDDRTFTQALEVLKLFKPGVIYMNGCGEPLLDPKIFDRVHEVSRLGYKPGFFTNGDFLTDHVIKELESAGLDQMVISPHDETYVVEEYLKNSDLNWMIGNSPVLNVRFHNWAGQMGWDSNLVKEFCNSLRRGRGYILVDGRMTRCCLDYSGRYPFGHVDDGEKLLDVEVEPVDLCKTCGGSP